MQNTHTIYCDEAGYTGNNLFSVEQPYFVYSSIAIERKEAITVISEVKDRFRLQMAELKGGKLVRTPRGKDAALWVLERCADKASLIAVDKNYALAGKFYEYIFEPVLSTHGALFYNINFHRFISNALYVHLVRKEPYSKQILMNFETAMRDKDFNKIERLYTLIDRYGEVSPFLRDIITFSFFHASLIKEELARLWSIDDLGSWALELSLMSVHGLLTKWGERSKTLEVLCDDSKALSTQIAVLNNMFNRTHPIYIELAGRRHSFTYNLAQPIKLVSSHDFPGVQIADIFASSLASALKNKEGSFSRRCLSICENVLHEYSIFPQLEYANLASITGFVNIRLLQLLIDRTLKGEDIFRDLPAFIDDVQRDYPEWIRQINK